MKRDTEMKGIGSTSREISLVSLVVKDRKRKKGKPLAYLKGESRRRFSQKKMLESQEEDSWTEGP